MNLSICSGALPGALYILLCVCAVFLRGGIQLQDLLAPLLLLQLAVWHSGDVYSMLRKEGRALVMFLVLAFIVSMEHMLRHTGNFYDFCVFAYMALLYIYFRKVPMSDVLQRRLGGGLLIFFWGLWLCGLIMPLEASSHLFYVEQNFDFEGVGILKRRFAAFFRNPNLLGAFFPVPLLLLSGWWKRTYSAGGRLCRLLLLGGAFLACLPLFSTVSKHLVMSFAVILGSWMDVQAFAGRRTSLYGGWGMVLLAGVVCWCTVLVLTFPLKSDFPWINTDCQSNYSLHQEIYCRMLARDSRGLILGRGTGELKQLYPRYADREKIRKVLEHYHGGHLTETYSTFMDPHNEFLNLLSFFGLPALLCLLCFFMRLFVRGLRGKNAVLLYFVTALLMCCLWDDLLSKRFVWIALALAVNSSGEIRVMKKA